ncbi:hypothetical protein C8R46DRAFT_1027710 [Mycena filopes]|nr:hypothetical protein C8R46DRAFT_1027710 [Mycena filopes]
MEARKCGKCHNIKALTAENWKAQFRGGGLHVASNCRVCSEKDRDSAKEWLKKRIVDLEAGLAVLKTQAAHPREAKIFINSMRAQNIGADVAAMATDVRRFTETATVRTTTWAQKGKKASAKFTRNTMGLYIP